MKIPQLNKSARSIEFKSYPDFQKSAVVKGWLFDGKTHRELDSDILELDSKVSQGWQSMGILHYLGLKKEFSGFFQNQTLEKTIGFLETNEQDFTQIIHFVRNEDIEEITSLESLSKSEQNKLDSSLSDSQKNRQERIKKSNKFPKRIKVYSYTYERNSDIVAEALVRANGYCEKCKCSAPFIRSKDNTPYLEVHHIKPLSQGGADTLKNTLALCPNCHRELHYGQT